MTSSLNRDETDFLRWLGGWDYCTGSCCSIFSNSASFLSFPISVIVEPVVCLREGERGTCLGSPIPPLRCYAHKIFLIFGEKRIIYSYNVLQSRS